jgi:hypothetical protein
MTQQSEDGKRHRALPRPALAHQAENLPRTYGYAGVPQDTRLLRIIDRDIRFKNRIGQLISPPLPGTGKPE